MRVMTLTPEALLARPTGTSSITRHSPLDLHELFRGALPVEGLVAPCKAVVAPGEMGLCPILRTDLIAPMLGLVNQHRASIGVGPVAIDARLQACAEWKSLNMGGYLYMDHDDPAPVVRRWADRMAAYYPITQAAAGENIAYEHLTAASVMLAWLSDYGHRVNVESDSWHGAGFAVAQTSPASSQPGLLFWTQDFGSAVPSAPVPQPPGGTMLTEWALNDLPLILADSHVRNWSKPALSGKPSAGGKDLAAIQEFINNPAVPVFATTPLGKGLLATAKRLAAK